MTFLKDILDYKRIEINEFKKTHSYSDFERQAGNAQKKDLFRLSLKSKRPGIIAEIKKASPSQGLICSDFSPSAIAREYSAIGVQAISVLTDSKFFSGHIEYLREVRRETEIPLLRKDFILDEIQILEAKAAGANAVLLIVAALCQKDLCRLKDFSEDAGCDVLTEVHDGEELKRALDCGAGIIGINNRNLKTFKIDLQTTVRLLPLIPGNVLKVSESGIENREDLLRLEEAGADAFLIGTSFMKSKDKKEFYRSLVHGA